MRLTPRHEGTVPAATQERQPVHSGERTWSRAWTGMSTGQARVQAPQSLQVSVSRTMRSGERKLASPRSAPYGQPQRHQAFFTTRDRSTSPPRTQAEVAERSRKKSSIFASAATL